MHTTETTVKVAHKFAVGDRIRSRRGMEYTVTAVLFDGDRDNPVRYTLDYLDGGWFGTYNEEDDIDNYTLVPVPKTEKIRYYVDLDVVDSFDARVGIRKAIESVLPAGSYVNYTYAPSN